MLEYVVNRGESAVAEGDVPRGKKQVIPPTPPFVPIPARIPAWKSSMGRWPFHRRGEGKTVELQRSKPPPHPRRGRSRSLAYVANTQSLGAVPAEAPGPGAPRRLFSVGNHKAPAKLVPARVAIDTTDRTGPIGISRSNDFRRQVHLAPP